MLENTIPSVDFVSDGAITTFPIPFPFADTVDIRAAIMPVDGDAWEHLSFGTEYQVDGNGRENGVFASGTLTLAEAQPDETKVRVWRDTDRRQDTSLAQFGNPYFAAVERGLDRSVMMAQENSRRVDMIGSVVEEADGSANMAIGIANAATTTANQAMSTANAATAAFSAHASKTDIHTTQAEKDEWNAKATKSDVSDALDSHKVAVDDTTIKGDGTAANPLRAVGGGGPGGGVSDHRDLTHRDASDAHPVSAITDLAKTLEDLSARAASNPNILVNTDLRNPINQRGYVDGTRLQWFEYAYDRWQSRNDGAMAKTGDGLRFTAQKTGTYPGLWQEVENAGAYSGKRLVLSARIRASHVVYIGFAGTISVQNWTPGDEDWRTVEVAADCPAGMSSLAVNVFLSPSNNYPVGAWFELEWIKLEEGQVATPWSVPDPATELARCQRYYYRITNDGTVFAISGTVVTQMNVRYFVPFPTTMRSTPAFTYGGEWYGYTDRQWANFSSMAATGFNESGVGINANWPMNQSVVAGHAATLRSVASGAYMAFDSEM